VQNLPIDPLLSESNFQDRKCLPCIQPQPHTARTHPQYPSLQVLLYSPITTTISALLCLNMSRWKYCAPFWQSVRALRERHQFPLVTTKSRATKCWSRAYSQLSTASCFASYTRQRIQSNRTSLISYPYRSLTASTMPSEYSPPRPSCVFCKSC
jgi:hypothetical protein